MYLWNIDALSRKLRTGELTEVESFRYFLIVLLAQMLPYMLPIRSEGDQRFYSMGFGAIIPFVWLISGIAGVLVCFRANQASDGVDFIRRFTCLAVPSTIRTFVFCLPVLILMTLFVAPFIPKGEGHTAAVIIMGMFIEVMILVQYIMIYRRPRGAIEPEPGPPDAAA